jgi:hypothetical protein
MGHNVSLNLFSLCFDDKLGGCRESDFNSLGARYRDSFQDRVSIGLTRCEEISLDEQPRALLEKINREISCTEVPCDTKTRTHRSLPIWRDQRYTGSGTSVGDRRKWHSDSLMFQILAHRMTKTIIANESNDRA